NWFRQAAKQDGTAWQGPYGLGLVALARGRDAQRHRRPAEARAWWKRADDHLERALDRTPKLALTARRLPLGAWQVPPWRGQAKLLQGEFNQAIPLLDTADRTVRAQRDLARVSLGAGAAAPGGPGWCALAVSVALPQHDGETQAALAYCYSATKLHKQ